MNELALENALLIDAEERSEREQGILDSIADVRASMPWSDDRDALLDELYRELDTQ